MSLRLSKTLRLTESAMIALHFSAGWLCTLSLASSSERTTVRSSPIVLATTAVCSSASSFTIMTTPDPAYADALDRHAVIGSTSALVTGKVKEKFEPMPNSLSTQRSPPMSVQSRREMVRPRPVPPYRRLQILVSKERVKGAGSAAHVVEPSAWQKTCQMSSSLSGLIPIPERAGDSQHQLHQGDRAGTHRYR